MGRSEDLIRRLTIDDADVLREAWNWDTGRPSWYRQMDQVFNRGTVEDFVIQLADPSRAFIGVWSNELYAVVVIQYHGAGVFEGHLLARRGTDIEMIARVVYSLLHDLLDYGLSEAIVWVAERNTSVRKLCARIGFQPDSVWMWKGAYRNRVIKWERYSIRREQLLMNIAA